MSSPRSAAVSIVLAALVVYFPTIGFGFVSWDDPAYVIHNKAVTEPGGLAVIWTSSQMPPGATNWPLVFTTFWAEHQIWGLHPTGYHLTNAVLHAAASALAFWFLLELGAGTYAAWLAAMLFAIHPIQVESVAWITERKNVLSGVFFFAALTEYVRFRRLGGGWRYALCMALYALALMSKSSVAPFPILLLLIDRLILDGHWSKASLKRAALPLLLSLLSALMTMSADVVSPRNLPYEQRPLVAATAFWFYLVKLVYPATLIPVYPRWQVDVADPIWWAPLLGLALLAAVLFWFRNRIDKWSLWGMCYYVLLLAPVVGLFPFGFMVYTFVSDHFVYLAALGPFLVLGRWIAGLDRPETASAQRLARWAVWIAVVFLGFRTIEQSIIWKDSESLWDYSKELSPATANDVIATSLFGREEYAEAAKHLREVIRHRPTDVYAWTSLGQCLFRSGNEEEGLKYLLEAARLDPTNVDAQVNLGNVWMAKGDYLSAEAAFERALRIRPGMLDVRLKLAGVQLRARDYAKAAANFQQVFDKAPRSIAARLGLAQSLDQRGPSPVAREHYAAIIETDPTQEEAWIGLAANQSRSKQYAAARQTLESARKHLPHSADLRWALAWLLATAGDEKVRDGQEALYLTESPLSSGDEPTSPQHDILAAIYADLGQFDEAIRHSKAALALDPDSATIRGRLKLYEANQPYRQP